MSNITDEEILAGIAALVHEIVGVDAASVSAGQAFTTDLGLDSLALQEIAVGIEERFGVSVADEQVSSLALVEDAVAHVRGALGSARA